MLLKPGCVRRAGPAEGYANALTCTWRIDEHSEPHRPHARGDVLPERVLQRPSRGGKATRHAAQVGRAGPVLQNLGNDGADLLAGDDARP